MDDGFLGRPAGGFGDAFEMEVGDGTELEFRRAPFPKGPWCWPS